MQPVMCYEHRDQGKFSCSHCVKPLDWKTICCIAEKLLLRGDLDAAELALGEVIEVPDLVAAENVENLIYRICPQQTPRIIVREVNVHTRPDALG